MKLKTTYTTEYKIADVLSYTTFSIVPMPIIAPGASCCTLGSCSCSCGAIKSNV